MKMTLIVLLLATSTDALGCFSMPLNTRTPYKGLTEVEAELTASDSAFYGYLMEASSTIKPSDETGQRNYKFLVIEPFKGKIKTNEMVDVVDRVEFRGMCDRKFGIEAKYLVYLEKDKNGQNTFGVARTSWLFEDRINMDNAEDVSRYEDLVEAGMHSDYIVTSRYDDGRPRIYVYSIENKIKKVRDAVASMKKPPSQH
jgi:hypothetical protein